MSDILHANIFFFITSVAVILLTILAIVALYFIIRILQNARDITDQVRRGGEKLAEDYDEIKGAVKKGVRITSFVQIIGAIMRMSSRKKKLDEEE